jgi:hypothetical protein
MFIYNYFVGNNSEDPKNKDINTDKNKIENSKISNIGEEILEQSFFSKCTDTVKLVAKVVWNKGDLGVKEQQTKINDLKNEITKECGGNTQLLGIYDLFFPMGKNYIIELATSFTKGYIDPTTIVSNLLPIVEINILTAIKDLAIQAKCNAENSPIETILDAFSKEIFGSIDALDKEKLKQYNEKITKLKNKLKKTYTDEGTSSIKEEIKKVTEEELKPLLTCFQPIVKLLFPKGKESLYIPEEASSISGILWSLLNDGIPTYCFEFYSFMEACQVDSEKERKWKDGITSTLNIENPDFLKTLPENGIYFLLSQYKETISSALFEFLNTFQNNDDEKESNKNIISSQNIASTVQAVEDIVASKNPNVRKFFKPVFNLIDTNFLCILNHSFKMIEKKGDIEDNFTHQLALDMDIPEVIKNFDSAYWCKIKKILEPHVLKISETIKELSTEDLKNDNKQINDISDAIVNEMDKKFKEILCNETSAQKLYEEMIETIQEFIPGFKLEDSKEVIQWLYKQINGESQVGDFYSSIKGIIKETVKKALNNSYSSETDKEQSFLMSLLNRSIGMSVDPISKEEEDQWKALADILKRQKKEQANLDLIDLELKDLKLELTDEEKEILRIRKEYLDLDSEYKNKQTSFNKLKNELIDKGVLSDNLNLLEKYTLVLDKHNEELNTLKKRGSLGATQYNETIVEAEKILDSLDPSIKGKITHYLEQKKIVDILTPRWKSANKSWKEQELTKNLKLIIEAQKNQKEVQSEVTKFKEEFERYSEEKGQLFSEYVTKLTTVLGLNDCSKLLPNSLSNFSAYVEKPAHQQISSLVIDNAPLFLLFREKNSDLEKLKSKLGENSGFISEEVINQIAKSVVPLLETKEVITLVENIVEEQFPDLKQFVATEFTKLVQSEQALFLQTLMQTLLVRTTLQVHDKNPKDFRTTVLKLIYTVAKDKVNPEKHLLAFFNIQNEKDLVHYGIPESQQKMVYDLLAEQIQKQHKENTFLYDNKIEREARFKNKLETIFVKKLNPTLSAVRNDLYAIYTDLGITTSFQEKESITLEKDVEDQIKLMKENITRAKNVIQIELNKIDSTLPGVVVRVKNYAKSFFSKALQSGSVNAVEWKAPWMEKLKALQEIEKRMTLITKSIEKHRNEKFGDNASHFIKILMGGVVEFTGAYFAETKEGKTNKNGSDLLLEVIDNILKEETPLKNSLREWFKNNREIFTTEFDELFGQFTPTSERGEDIKAVRQQFAHWIENFFFEPITHIIVRAIEPETPEFDEKVAEKLFKVLSDHFTAIDLSLNSDKKTKNLVIDPKKYAEVVNKKLRDLKNNKNEAGLKYLLSDDPEEMKKLYQSWAKVLMPVFFPKNKIEGISFGGELVYENLEETLIPFVISLFENSLDSSNIKTILQVFLTKFESALLNPSEGKKGWVEKPNEAFDQMSANVVERVLKAWGNESSLFSDPVTTLVKWLPMLKNKVYSFISKSITSSIKEMLDGELIEKQLNAVFINPSLVGEIGEKGVFAEVRKPQTPEQKIASDKLKAAKLDADLTAANRKAVWAVYRSVVNARFRPIVNRWNEALQMLGISDQVKVYLDAILQYTIFGLLNLVINAILYFAVNITEKVIQRNAKENMSIFVNETINKNLILNIMQTFVECYKDSEIKSEDKV